MRGGRVPWKPLDTWVGQGGPAGGCPRRAARLVSHQRAGSQHQKPVQRVGWLRQAANKIPASVSKGSLRTFWTQVQDGPRWCGDNEEVTITGLLVTNNGKGDYEEYDLRAMMHGLYPLLCTHHQWCYHYFIFPQVFSVCWLTSSPSLTESPRGSDLHKALRSLPRSARCQPFRRLCLMLEARHLAVQLHTRPAPQQPCAVVRNGHRPLRHQRDNVDKMVITHLLLFIT